MNFEGNLPAKAFENGTFLVSSTDELGLIRAWLQQAPTSLFIVRVIHHLNQAAQDVFQVACSFPPTRLFHQHLQVQDYVRERWQGYVRSLGLPAVVWVKRRRVQVWWEPADCEGRSGPDPEEPAPGNGPALKWDTCIRTVAKAGSLKGLEPLYGTCLDCVSTLLHLYRRRLPDRSFTQESLEESIYNLPDVWFYLLARARVEGIASPIALAFQERLECLRQSGTAAALVDTMPEWPREAEPAHSVTTPLAGERNSLLWAFAAALLDDLMSRHLDSVNQFLRMIG